MTTQSTPTQPIVRTPKRPREADIQRGQATVEYALILLVAAVVAMLVITWATAGGGAGQIGAFFDSVIGRIISKATGMF